tara:strand:- start:699 stop:1853 length:1155 start_codon:yes stop_codon:yes gene_type:complete
MALTKVSTPAIKDEAITLAKLLHGDSNSNGKFLRANNGADPTFETIDLTALSASNLTSGTLPDARFPATLPAASAANLTNIPAANITGTLPAIDGSNLTGITSTTINTNADNRIITGSGSANTLNGEANLTFDGTTLGLNKGGLTNLQKLVIQGSGNSTGDNLTLNNWGNSDGDYWTIGVNMTANSGGNYAKTNTALRSVGINLDGRMGRVIINASETSTSTISDAHTFTRDGSHYMDGSLYLGGETSSSHELEDYEEGTWTPGVDGSTYGGNSYGYNTRNGNYVKIGRMVQCNFYLSWSNFNGNGNLQITGLPFATTTTNNAQYAGAIMTDGLNWPKNGTIVTHNWYGISYFRLYVSDDNGGWSAVNCDGSAAIIGTLNYMTN